MLRNCAFPNPKKDESMFYTDDLFFFVQNHQGPVFNQINQWLARSQFRCFGFSSAQQLLERIDQIGPAASVAIFGPVIQDMSGLQLASRLRTEVPEVSSVLVLRSSDIRTATQAVLAGNQRLIFDDCDAAETLTLLGEATQLAKENQLRIRGRQAIVNRLQRLTAEQLQLLQHWCQGAGNQQLRELLGVDEATLHEQKKQIRVELEIDRLVQLLWEVNRHELDIDSLLAGIRPRDNLATTAPIDQPCRVKLCGQGDSLSAAGASPSGINICRSKRLRTAI
jgi:FixJ family two-component response regulator